MSKNKDIKLGKEKRDGKKEAESKEPSWTRKEKWLLKTCSDFGRKIEKLSKDIEKQNTVIMKNNFLLEKLANQFGVRTNEDIPSVLKHKEQYSNYEDLKIFPIKSLIELESIDRKIKDVPKADIISYIKHYIGDASIKESIHTLFDESVIVQVNWAGTLGLTPVKNLELFSTFVFEAVKTPAFSYAKYISEMKAGFRFAKNQYKKKRLSKKVNSSTVESRESVDTAATSTATKDRVSHDNPSLMRKMSHIYPIKSLTALERIDTSIKALAITEADIASYIRKVFGVREDNIPDIVQEIFDESVLLKINWSGKRGMVPIKDLKLFNTHIFEAVRTPDLTYSQYISQIKKGIQLAKRKMYNRKAKILSKNKNVGEETEKAEEQQPEANGVLKEKSDQEVYWNYKEPKIEIYESKKKQENAIGNNFMSKSRSKSFDTTPGNSQLGDDFSERLENDTISYGAFSENGDSELYSKFDTSNIFPIKSYRALELIDRYIQTIPESDLIDYIRLVVGSASIADSMPTFFGERLITQINWAGNNRMKPLKNMKLFNTYVFEAVKTGNYQYDQYISEINKGLQMVKKELPKKRKAENEESYEEEGLSHSMYNSTMYPEDVHHSGVLSIFPIRTLEKLNQVDEDILGIPDEDIIKHIKGIIGNMELKSCLQYLFDDSIILEINWNGAFNKIAAKNFKLFNTYLFEAVRTPKFGYKEYAEEMKKSFRHTKTQIYRRTLKKSK